MALVLSRKPGERIYINDDIQIIISGIHWGQVKVAIEAPKEYSIHREEIYRKIMMEKNHGNH